MQKESKITLTHVVAKALALSMSKNRRDVGRISWGYVSLFTLKQVLYIVQKI